MPISNSKTVTDDVYISAGDTGNSASSEEWVWNAMNDGSRRKILDLLRVEALTTNALCAHFDFSRFAVMKHLKVLEKANLIMVERKGRERLNHLNPLPLQSIYRRWIKPFEDIPADRLLRLKRIAELSVSGD
ncbi:MAG: ArsR/SmtB family transcription factor [Gammaproteobacteria bacterium]